jgi:hypothetical protein
MLQVDDRLQGGEQHFELLELLRRIAAEGFQIDLFAGLQSFDQFGDAPR